MVVYLSLCEYVLCYVQHSVARAVLRSVCQGTVLQWGCKYASTLLSRSM
jgi:hypothetical protein